MGNTFSHKHPAFMIHTITPRNKISKLAVSIEIVVMGLLIVLLYADAIASMVSKWAYEDYNHGYLIPFIVLYLLWDKRKELTGLPSTPSWMGLAPILFGLGLFWLGELGGEFFTLYISLWFVLVGLCWTYLGWNKLKRIAFPFLIILTAFPFPKFLYTKISWQLKLISSQLGVAMMQAFGMSAFREGNVIDLGFTKLQVVDACSGLRYLIPLFVLGILLAYFFKAAWWKKVVLVVSTVPISIFVNSLRIAAVGVLYPIWGARVAEGFFHDFSGWFIFMVALALLVIEMLALNGFRSFRRLGSSIKIEGQKVGRSEGWTAGEKGVMASHQATTNTTTKQINQSTEGFASNLKPQTAEGDLPQTSSEAILKPPTKKGFAAFFYPPQFVVAVILLSATLALSHGVEFREKIPMNKSFDGFPMRVGEWAGVRQSMEQKFVDALDLSDYVIVDYRNKAGKTVNFYTAYYQSQRKGESIHSPATCLPGGGWIFKQAGGVSIPLKDHNPGTMKVNRAFMQKNDFRQLSYYWFPARGRILTNAYQLKIYTFWDALTRQRTDGALVRVITPVYEDEALEEAEKRLQGFVGVINPILSEYLPE